MCHGRNDNDGQNDASGWVLDDLTAGERALLGALRGWRAATRSGGGLGVVLHAVKGAGLPPGAALPLAALLGVLDIAAHHEGRRLHCVACRRVGRDEALLLDAVAAAQCGAHYEVRAILADWFPPSASAGMAAARLTELAGVLGDAEAWFPGGRSDRPVPMLLAAE